MKKFFSKFLIVILILGSFLAPATPKIDTQNHFSLVKNEANSQNVKKWYFKYQTKHTSGQLGTVVTNHVSSGYDENKYEQCKADSDKQEFLIEPCTLKEEAPDAGGNIVTNTTTNNTNPNYVAEADYGCGTETIFTGCLVKGIYTIFFNLFAYLARLSAKILDYFAFYSISSIAYQDKSFIDNGWTVVRDLGNLFFIIALLYIAGKTVLGLNGSDNKKVVTMVVVMALLINFSLFISKIVIDGSNILARVFYAAIDSKTENGTPLPPDYDGEKSITIGLVKVFDPQAIFTNNQIIIKDNLGSFAIILIISIILMIYLMYIFLSISFVFVGRVAMLWILMIFSPIAFASLTMPGVRIPGFGFKEWWSQLFNQSFLAPIFVFFLYLIISFGDAMKFVDSTSDVLGDAGLSNVGSATSYETLNLFMKVFVPFMILFVLLKKAKEITVKMAGEIGAGMSKVGGILGTAALGLSAAGVAMAGRQVIGRGAAALTKREGAMEYAEQRKAYRENLNHWESGGRVGAKPTWANHKDTYNAKQIAAGKPVLSENVLTKLGGRINSAQLKAKDIAHGAHEYEDIKKQAGLAGVSESNISAVNEKDMLEKFTKTKRTEIENDIKEGKVKGVDSRSEYEKKNRKIITENMINNPDPTVTAQLLKDRDIKEIIDPKTNKGTGKYELTKQGEQNRESEISTGYNQIIKENTTKIAKEKFEHFRTEAKEKNTIFDKTAAKSTSSNYDIRDFKPELKGLNMTSKASLFVLGMIASSLRSGLKKAEIDPGKGAGDITKDLTNTITTAISGLGKSMKVDIGGGGGHGGGGHDDHGGGHDDHGHGGGGHGH